jgi:hypothetical protein
MELYWSLKSFVPWLYPYFTALEDKHASCHSLTVTYPPGTHNPCEPSWALLWGCCDGRNGWIACQWSYIEASKALFHGSTHISQLWKTNMPHVTRWQSHTHQAPTTHVNPHGHCCEVVVMVEMDGLHANGVILKPQKLCSMTLPIFQSFGRQTCLMSLADTDSYIPTRHPQPMSLMGIVVRLLWW